RHASLSPDAAQARAVAQRAAGSRTERSARPCRSARPRTCSGAYRRTPSGLQSAVELRLGEKRAGQLQDLVGAAQFLVLTLQLPDPLGICRRHAIADT